jgi:hypothetical protein
MKNLAAAQESITGSCGHGYGCCGMEVTILNFLKKTCYETGALPSRDNGETV